MADSTIAAIAARRWGITVSLPVGARFRQADWSYQEPTGRVCPSTCGGPLHSFRKPYRTQGRVQRYVALVCSQCGRAWTLGDLGVGSYDGLLKGGGASPHPPTPPVRSGAVQQGDQRVAVVDYWRAVELFTTQRIPSPDPASRCRDVQPGSALPWGDGNLPDVGPKKTWRHTLYGGVHDLGTVHALLGERLEDDPFDVDERSPRGDSAVFSFQVDAEGRFLVDTFVLSSAAWALGRTSSPGAGAPGWLDGFGSAEDDVLSAVETVLTDAADAATGVLENTDGVDWSPPLDHSVMVDIAQTVADQVGWVLDAHRWRILSTVVRVDSEPSAPFLNSFIADDLERVATALRAGQFGGALAAYLSETDGVGRIDVRSEDQRAAVDLRLAPEGLPTGRWPTSTSRPLARSQQLAVNETLGAFSTGTGVIGVNGPPGTGKTTMLRDVIAGIVTRRAEQLAELRSPADAFGRELMGWRSNRKAVWFKPLRTEFTGNEIVIASANNGAVENVTRELPDVRQIDDPWKDTDHFRAEATQLLGAPAWGLIAAVLGNKKNRTEFVNRLWYPSPSERPGAAGTESSGANAPAGVPVSGLREVLRREQAKAGPSFWDEAVEAYRRAQAVESGCRRVRESASAALRRLPALTRAVVSAAAMAREKRAELARRTSAAEAVRGPADQRQSAADRCAERLDQHFSARPGALETLFSFGAASRRWRAEHDELSRAQREADGLLDQALEALRYGIAVVEAAAAEVRAAERIEADSILERDACRDAVEQARRAGAVIPDDSAALDDDLELVAPWLDPEWDAARSELFLAALELHRAFLVAGGEHTMQLVSAAIEAVRGAIPRDVDPAAVEAAWQGLFLLVPVVSTTFSSVQRMFRDLGPETIGWLLIDEAGQAAPQSAVGTMWRSRRVVAVGDPRQLEPVVTILNSTQGRLRAERGVSARWRPFGESVQTLVDRQTALGTDVDDGDGDPSWIGTPLRVHRRCDDPMFSVVNRAVYGGLMVRGNAFRPDPLTSLGVRPSSWIDVRSSGGSGHWIPEEGVAVRRLLTELIGESGVRAEDVLVVTPFRAVADKLRSVVPAGVTSGTVHVSQGKQAAVVVLVLGSDPSKPGARAWVTQSPNVFNVAVSRAQHRIFVIGDRSAWATLPYFSDLAAALETER